jgi:hypothetical protein
MRIYWWQGGLHVEPENERERSALFTLSEATVHGQVPELLVQNASGSTAPSGSVVES